MKPSFALNLSHKGIGLYHRAGAAWVKLGDVALDAPDLDAELAVLRKSAAALSPSGLTSKLVIPNSQILYTRLPDPGGGDAARKAAIRKQLDGATPYALDEIAYDWREQDGTLHVAAVAHETLDEAEAFAQEHRFNPLSFAADPAPDDFPGEPYFGPSRAAETLLPDGESVEPDEGRMQVRGKSPHANAAPAPDPEVPPEPEPTPTPEITPEPDVEPAPTPQEDPGPGGPAEVPDMPEPDMPAPPPEIPIAPPEMSATAETEDVSPFVSRRVVPPEEGSGARISETPSRLALDSAPDDGKRAETTHVPITAPILAEEEPEEVPAPPRKAKNGKPAKGILPEPPPMPSPRQPLTAEDFRADPPVRLPGTTAAAPAALAAGLSPEAIDDFAGSAKTADDEAEALTVFGARRERKPARSRPRFLGLMLTGFLIAVLLAVFLVTGWVSDDTPAATVPDDAPLTGSEQSSAEQAAPPAPDMQEIAEADTQPAEPAAPDQGVTQTAPEAGETHDAERAPQPGGMNVATANSDAPFTAPAGPVPATTEQAEAPETEPVPDAPEPALQIAADNTSPALGASDVESDSAEGDLTIATVDPAITEQDATALPRQSSADAPPATPASPTPQGTAFDLDARGLVEATPGGSLTPEGAVVILGRPRTVPAPRPQTQVAARAAEEQTAASDAARAALEGFRPTFRPADVAPQSQTEPTEAVPPELADAVPEPRPDEIEDLAATQAAEVSAQAAAAAAAASAASTAALAQPEPIVIASALLNARPAPRPRDFATTVARARDNDDASPGTGDARALLATAAPRAPSVPSSASVAKQATVRNAINLNRLNLIGVYGASSDRRALVRLPSGRYEKVKVGDRLDGGRVRSIGSDSLIYTKSGRDVELEVKG